MDYARSMFSVARLKKIFWAEAFNIACYLANRAPTTAFGSKILEEVKLAKSVNYSFILILVMMLMSGFLKNES